VSIIEALDYAKQLKALVKIGIIDKRQANEAFRKRHGIPLFIENPKVRKSRAH
jgi:hypothetical protein